MVINGGSPDNSQKIIDEYCKKDSRIKSFIKENGGISSARNYGIKKAQGEYIWFVDSDDLVVASEFEKFYKKAKKLKDIEIICGNYNSFIDGHINEITKNSPTIKEVSRSMVGTEFLKMLEKNLAYNCSVWKNLYNRKFLLKNNLYFKEGIIMEDGLYNLQTLMVAKKIIYLDTYFYLYRLKREGSTTEKNVKKIADASLEYIRFLLLNVEKIEKIKYLKERIIDEYFYYINYYKKRNLEIEKKIWKIKGIGFIKIKTLIKLWKRTYVYYKYKIRDI